MSDDFLAFELPGSYDATSKGARLLIALSLLKMIGRSSRLMLTEQTDLDGKSM
jgi:hypothetical protein